MSKHYYYTPVPTEAELELAKARTESWCEGYAQARAEAVRAAYAAADAFKIPRDTFARVLVAQLNGPKQRDLSE